MYFLFVNLLLLNSLFDSRYHKIRFDILIILLLMSIIFSIENSDKAKLVLDILFITLFFAIFYISNYFFNNNLPFSKKTFPALLSSGDKILFLSIMLFSGAEKGVLIILFGLLAALIWAYVTKVFFILPGYQRRTIPFYPFMAFSLIIVGIING